MTSHYQAIATALLLITAINCRDSQAAVIGNGPDCLHTLSNGHDASVDRDNVDQARSWTFVDDTSVQHHGLVRTVKMYSKVENRPLQVGVYRPDGVTECRYTLVKKYTFDRELIKIGYLELPIPNDAWMTVSPGDHMGFTWTSKGVMAYSKTETQIYCEHSGSFREGQTKKMNKKYGNRIYSFSVDYTSYSSSLDIGYHNLGLLTVPDDHAAPFTYISPQRITEHGLIKGFEFSATLALSSTTVRLCTNRGKTLRCSGGKTLGIMAAYYGGVTKCDANTRIGTAATGCQKENALDIIREDCQEKKSCYVRAHSKNMGDLDCLDDNEAFLEVVYTCQDTDSKTENILGWGDNLSVQRLDTDKIGNEDPQPGFTYLQLPQTKMCSGQPVGFHSVDVPGECGLWCDLDPDCEGFNYVSIGETGMCEFVSICDEQEASLETVSGYRKAGDLILAVYEGPEETDSGYSSGGSGRGGVCKLEIQEAYLVRNVPSGSHKLSFTPNDEVPVKQGFLVGFTSLTASLHRIHLRQDLVVGVSCEREDLPYRKAYNYYHGANSSLAYDLSVVYTGSACTQFVLPQADVPAAPVVELPVIDADCKDELSAETCQKYLQDGNCNKHSEYFMGRKYCRLTCGLCQVTKPKCESGQTYRADSNLCQAHCVDKANNCNTYPGRGKCEREADRRRCPVSCDVCDESCQPGYELKNGRCVEINECKQDVCPANARCANRWGYYECICRSGHIYTQLYQSDTKQGTCEEDLCRDRKSQTYCNRYKNRCHDPKRQVTMLRYCMESCDLCGVDCDKAGYMINTERQCVDIDECQRKDLYKCGRDALCSNTDGGYECVCPPEKPLGDPKKRCLAECKEGYHLVGTRCKRINPCTNGLHTCPEGVKCQLTKTSYRCRCPRGATDVIDPETQKHQCIKELLCRASGDPHFYSFDVQKIDFMGTCVYTLVSTQCPGHISPLPVGIAHFTVDVKNQHRYGKTRVSYLQYIEVEIGGDTVRLDQERVVFINGSQIQLPYDTADAPYSVQFEANNVVFRTRFSGLRIVWSGSTKVYVYMDSRYQGHVCGLCGNADGDKANDMVTKEGTLVRSEAELGDSWRVTNKGGEECTTVTDESPECTEEQNAHFKQACGVIEREEFSPCHSVVSPKEIIQECTFDLCAEFEGPAVAGLEEHMEATLCDYYKDYADLCLFHGITVNWDKEGLCPHNPECPADSKYVHSVSCSPSCADPAGLSCLDQPIGGCQCEPGYFLEGDSSQRCVLPEDCGCVFEEVYHSVGKSWMNADCTQKYRCIGFNVLETWDIDCEDPDEATCGSEIPEFGPGQHGCYCNDQDPESQIIRTCDEQVSDVLVLDWSLNPPEDDDIVLPVIDPFLPMPGFPGLPLHDTPIDIPNVEDPDIDVSIPVVGDCQDTLPSEVCEDYRVKGNCGVVEQFVLSKKYCQLTCGLCDVTRPPCDPGQIYRHDSNQCEDHCMDRVEECPNYPAQEKCVRRGDKLRCPVSCEVCMASCSRGYRIVEGECVDINECEENENLCPANARCANRRGYYECLCRAGYEYTQIYEYATHQGFCQEMLCANKRSDKYCTNNQERCHDPKRQVVMLRYCKESCDLCGVECDKVGYMINSDRQCVDIDECQRKDLYKCGRDAVCSNTDGGYECVCPPEKPLGDPKKRCLAECEEGYELIGTRCKRINPCTAGLHTCPEEAKCQLTKTSYRCRCPHGETDVIDPETQMHQCIKEFVCRASGDPHYYSFDGAKIDYQGICPHVLVSTNCPAHIDPLPEGLAPFDIYVQNHHRNGKTRVSFLKYLLVVVGEDWIRLDQQGKVYVNDQPLELPYAPADSPYALQHEGDNVVLTVATMGLRVVWSGTTTARVYIGEQYQGHVCGICGNADHDVTNDMVTRDGELVTSEVKVGESWKVTLDGAEEECVDNPEEIPECSAEENAQFAVECERILNPPFSECHAVVPRGELIEDCMFDLCAEWQGRADTGQLEESVETKCDLYKAYADECLAAGVSIEWDKEALCPHNPECPADSEYRHEVTCAPSCADLSGYSSCLDEPMGGCQCRPGYLQDGESPLRCVLPHQCGCIDGDMYHSVGKSWLDEECTKKYRCIGHNVVEVWDIDCDPEKATCSSQIPEFGAGLHGCYCLIQDLESGIIHTCDENIRGPEEIEEDVPDENNENLPVVPPLLPPSHDEPIPGNGGDGGGYPFPPFGPSNDVPIPPDNEVDPSKTTASPDNDDTIPGGGSYPNFPFGPSHDVPIPPDNEVDPSKTTASQENDDTIPGGGSYPNFPFGPSNDEPIPGVGEETTSTAIDQPDTTQTTTYIPPGEPEHPVWDYDNGIVQPHLNDSEDNSYFQLAPEPTPQLKPRPLGLESCVIKDSYLSASTEQLHGEAYRARPLSCNKNEIPSGWKPQEDDTAPHLQIDLGSPVSVHGIGTLGHYNESCWVEAYKVYVSNSSDDGSFVALKDKDTGEDRIFDGNHDQNTWHHHCFHRYYGQPLTARYVRLVPVHQTRCEAMRVELYGFRKADDPQLVDALETDAWTKNTSGCQCYFDHSSFDCACCEGGGCQCPSSNRHQCVQCGYSVNCGIPENNDHNDQEDPWTKSPSGCPCPEDPTDLSCACCQKYSCNCGSLQPNQCVECGHPEQCGDKPEVFGPPPVCVPKTCPATTTTPAAMMP